MEIRGILLIFVIPPIVRKLSRRHRSIVGILISFLLTVGYQLYNTSMNLHSQVTLYDVLEVSPSATSKEIQAAFRRLSLKYHPDRNAHPDALGKFQAISEAVKTLTNPNSRHIYDHITHNVGIETSFKKIYHDGSDMQSILYFLVPHVQLFTIGYATSLTARSTLVKLILFIGVGVSYLFVCAVQFLPETPYYTSWLAKYYLFTPRESLDLVRACNSELLQLLHAIHLYTSTETDSTSFEAESGLFWTNTERGLIALMTLQSIYMLQTALPKVDDPDSVVSIGSETNSKHEKLNLDPETLKDQKPIKEYLMDVEKHISSHFTYTRKRRRFITILYTIAVFAVLFGFRL